MLTAAAIGLAALPATAQAAPSTLYVFGDSLSDNGNLYAYTGQPNPVTGGLAIPVAPPYAQGGFTNGPNYAERLWDALGFAGDLAPVVLGGTNYAVGGARSRYHSFDVGAGGLPVADPAAFASLSLSGQMDRYGAAASAGADSSALYLVWAGANDLQDVLQLALTQGAGAANVRLEQAVADVVGVIGDLVALGARQLLVPTVPDIGAMPVVAAIGVGAQQVARQYSLAFNQAIDAALQAVTGTPDLELLRFDAFGLLDRVAQEPAASGFTNIADACLQGLYLVPTPGAPAPTICSNPDRYLFWDIVHPSASAHVIIGREMYADVRAAFVPEPASPMLLLAAVLALLASRVRRWKPQAMPAA
jgi:phospholipase/lecithinase/hemolysin